MARAMWRGAIQFGLVTIPIKLYLATEARGGLSFNLLHKECLQRINMKVHCPEHGEISRSETVRGFEYAKGQYVVIDEGDFDRMLELGAGIRVIAKIMIVLSEVVDLQARQTLLQLSFEHPSDCGSMAAASDAVYVARRRCRISSTSTSRSVTSCVASSSARTASASMPSESTSTLVRTFSTTASVNSVVVAPPPYYPTAQSELLSYISRLTARLPLPVFLYNMPSLTKVRIEPETVLAAANLPGVVGLKDSSGDWENTRAILERFPGFAVFPASESMMSELTGSRPDVGSS